MKLCLILFQCFMVVTGLNAQCNSDFDLGEDLEICLGENVSLDAGNNYFSYLWNDSTVQQTLDVNQEGIYYCTVSALDNSTNFIINGDFEAGNNSFTTDYSFFAIADVFGPNASYGIVSNPNAWFNPFSACTDHTSGTGNMMVLDGSSTNSGNDAIWCQSVSVDANTTYNFSYWVQSVTGAPFANLRVEINGISLGNALAPNVVCLWEQTEYNWNSSTSTMAQICIFDNELSGNGNDFAIDDIALLAYCSQTDSINITIANRDTLFQRESLCQGDSFLINNTYQNQNGIYYQQNMVGDCIVIEEIELIFNPIPVINAGTDTTIISGTELTLTAESNLDNTLFEWYIFNSLVSEIESFNSSFNENTTIAIIGEKENCKSTTLININVVDQSNALLFPTGFTPNNDGLNDVFRLIDTQNVENIELSIYNRWGELIHSGQNELHPWDGQFKNTPQGQGVYIFNVQITYIDGTNNSSSGTVSLLR